MGKTGNLWGKLTLATDLSDEPIPGLPLIEIIDNRRVLIENHKGVNEYGQNMIRVRIKSGSICICGQKLELAKMSKSQLIICGLIESVQLCRG